MRDVDRLKAELLTSYHLCHRRDGMDSGIMLDAFVSDLRDLDFGACADAVGHLRQTGDRFPTSAEVRRAVDGDPEAEARNAALKAWVYVCEYARNVREALTREHPSLIQRIVHEMGGWPALGSRREDDLMSERQWFENRYVYLATRMPPSKA